GYGGRVWGGIHSKRLKGRHLKNDPADIFRLAKKPDALNKALAERRAEQAAERRAKEGKEEVKKTKKDDDEDSKLVANLIGSIEARRKIAMDRFINALGIRHDGETNARLIARNYKSIDAFIEAMEGKGAVEELQEIGGVGEVLAEAIKDFFDEPHNRKLVNNLLKEVEVVPLAAPKTSGSPVVGKTVV